jgi:hypothetical protein
LRCTITVTTLSPSRPAASIPLRSLVSSRSREAAIIAALHANANQSAQPLTVCSQYTLSSDDAATAGVGASA